jgi:hypothetical protein
MRKRMQHTPVSPPEHQGSRRVGPPVPRPGRFRDVRGFLLPLALAWWLVAFGVTVVEFGAMIYSWSQQCGDCTFRGRGSGDSF